MIFMKVISIEERKNNKSNKKLTKKKEKLKNYAVEKF